MTNVIEHNGSVRYELTAPWTIGASLRPAVQLDDGSIELWVHQWQDSEGRVAYGYRVTCDGATVASGTDLRSGVGAWPDLTGTLSSLLSFAAAEAEAERPTALGEWHMQHDSELYCLTYDEEGNELSDEQ